MTEGPGEQKKSAGIKRCPKCRSINPPDATVCFKCGKVLQDDDGT